MSSKVEDPAIGRRIHEVRSRKGLSQRALECDGVTYAYISRIEGGDRTPSLSALIKIADKLGVSALYLLEGNEEGVCPFCKRAAHAA